MSSLYGVLNIVSTGLDAINTAIQSEANDVSNANSHGYEKHNVVTKSLFFQNLRNSGTTEATENANRTTPTQLGTGTKISGIYRINTNGALLETGNVFDFALVGAANYFRLRKNDGTFAYTKTVSLVKNNEGRLSTVEGYELDPPIELGERTINNIEVTEDGIVLDKTEPNAVEEVGQVSIFSFINPQGLVEEGNNLLIASEASGEANEGIPNEEGFAKLKSGYKMESNVNTVQSLMNLMKYQKSYNLQIKYAQAADEMADQVNQMKK